MAPGIRQSIGAKAPAEENTVTVAKVLSWLVAEFLQSGQIFSSPRQKGCMG